MALKDNIKSARTSLRLTLDDVAKIVGVSRQTIQRYESGVIGNIPSDRLEKLAIALHTTPGTLMGWENDGNNIIELSQPCSLECSNEEKEIIKKYRSLSHEGQSAIRSFIDFTCSKKDSGYQSVSLVAEDSNSYNPKN